MLSWLAKLGIKATSSIFNQIYKDLAKTSIKEFEKKTGVKVNNKDIMATPDYIETYLEIVEQDLKKKGYSRTDIKKIIDNMRKEMEKERKERLKKWKQKGWI